MAQHGLELALAIVSGTWFVSRTLVNFGEWKHGVAATTSVDAATIERLRLEIVAAATKARHDAVEVLNHTLGKIDLRLDKASEKSSELAGRVQALPTRDEFNGAWKELTHLRELVEMAHVERAALSERVARLEARS